MTTTNREGTVVVDHPIGTRGRLTVRLTAAEIRLGATDGDRVVVRTPDGVRLSDRVVVEAADGGLTIREKDTHGITFSIGRRVIQVEIDVPAAAEVVIDAASGWVDVRGLRGEQRYRLVSAESRLVGVAGRIELNTVSGDAAIELDDAADLAIRSVSGDVSVQGGRLESLRVGTTSGDVRVDSPLVGRTGNTVETLSGDVSVVAAGGMRVEARTVSGDLASDLPNRSEGRMGRRTLVVGDGSVELGFRSVSGDLRIRDAAASRGAGREAHGAHPTDRPGSSILRRAPKPPVLPHLPHSPHSPFPPAAAGEAWPFGSPEAETAPPKAETAPPEAASGEGAQAAPADDPVEAERMTILRALEQGELDVPTAIDRLAALDADASDPSGGPSDG